MSAHASSAGVKLVVKRFCGALFCQIVFFAQSEGTSTTRRFLHNGIASSLQTEFGVGIVQVSYCAEEATAYDPSVPTHTSMCTELYASRDVSLVPAVDDMRRSLYAFREQRT